MEQEDAQGAQPEGPQGKERMYSLSEIITITGHNSTRAAYALLWKQKRKPDAYKAGARAPLSVYRKDVVLEVFQKHLVRAAKLKNVTVEELFTEIP